MSPVTHPPILSLLSRSNDPPQQGMSDSGSFHSGSESRSPSRSPSVHQSLPPSHSHDNSDDERDSEDSSDGDADGDSDSNSASPTPDQPAANEGGGSLPEAIQQPPPPLPSAPSPPPAPLPTYHFSMHNPRPPLTAPQAQGLMRVLVSAELKRAGYGSADGDALSALVGAVDESESAPAQPPRLRNELMRDFVAQCWRS